MESISPESQKMHKFEQLLREAIDERPTNQLAAEEFFSPASKRKRFVIGKNEQSANLAKLVSLAGVIDDYASAGTNWNGIPLFKTADVPKDALIANCSTSISPVDVSKRLDSAGLLEVLGIPELVHASRGRLSTPWFVEDMRSNFSINRGEWIALYDRLADAESKQTLLDVSRYRLSANAAYMQGYKVRMEEQYFEDFLSLNDEVFVDAGGYNGDTTEIFCSRFPDYRRVIFFEPSKLNMAAARLRLERFPRIDFHAEGLSDRSGELYFDPDAGSASAVSERGSVSIHVTTLDESVKTPVSFIKMDLEGWEIKAIEGSAGHIRDARPKLALAVYHSAKDFCEIPALIDSLVSDYEIYLRHYTQGWSETVMYFVPRVLR
jgi:FkbM family methyltransferase